MPERWINHLFAEIEASYGARFLDMWRDTDMAKVKRKWAEKLGRFDPAAIRWALEACDGLKFPPTLPEFLDLCKQAPRPAVLALPEPKCDAETAQRHLATMNAVICGKIVP